MQKLILFLLIVFTQHITRGQTCPSANTRLLGNDTSLIILCADDVVNISTLYNTTGLTKTWDIADPTTAGMGFHKLMVSNGSGCKDTAFIIIKQDIKTWLGNHSDDWNDSLNWTNHTVPNENTHVIINGSATYPCIVKSGDAKAASIQVNKDGNYQILNDHKLAINANCSKLPSLIELGTGTIILDDETSQLIQEVNQGNVKFVGNSAQLENLTTSNIIISKVTTNAPTGFLRKIISIDKQASKDLGVITYIVSTTFATLTEAFAELHVDYTKAFNPESSLQHRPNSALAFNIDMPDIVLLDGDENNFTKDDQIRVSGSLEVTPKLHLLVDISHHVLNSAKIEGDFESILNLSATAGDKIEIIKKKKNIYSLPLPWFNIPFTPLIVTPSFDVNIGAEGSGTIQMTASYTNTTQVKAYLSYENEDWNSGHTYTPVNKFNLADIAGISAEAKIYIEPALTFTLFESDFAEGIISAQAYLKASAQLLPTPDCELRAGISAGAEAKLSIFGWTLGAKSYPEIFNVSERLYTCVAKPPILTTSTVTDITYTTAISGGKITDSGDSKIIARGICWSKNHDPDIKNNFLDSLTKEVIDTGGLGSFTANISNLTPDIKYYVRAYAINETDTAYGEEVSFTPGDSTFTDPRDEQVYRFKHIGTQVWMTQNLNYASSGSYCQSNNTNNCAVYGRLYNWNAALIAAPPGWHLPTDQEWLTLRTYLAGNAGAAKDTTKWSSPNTGATNSSGFTALPGGYRNDLGNYITVGNNGFWWSSTYATSTAAGSIIMSYNNTAMEPGNYYKLFSFSVRCIRD